MPALRRLLSLSTLLAAACSSAPEAVLDPDTVQATRVANIAVPEPGLITAGQPTPEQLEELVRLGVRRVISLRPPSEEGTGWEEAKAAELGIEFTRIPIAGEADVDVAHARQLAAELAKGPEPALLYCGSSNRVGALLAMKAFHVDGKSAEEALAYGKAAGLKKLEPTVRERLQ
ncbi:MAG TPA: sulfur transferase domain-containing protein [Planctomycetota bacterium]|nr:sulfur transferase domain-containing protein [Planctomycetota bacterium]